MNIKPLSDRILLKAMDGKDQTTNSGIYLLESKDKERPYIYEVISVGPGKKDTQITVKPGDKVLSGQYSGDDVKIDGEEYKIVAMEYILAVVS